MKRPNYLLASLLSFAIAALLCAYASAEDWYRITAPGPSPRAAVGARLGGSVVVAGGMAPVYSSETWVYASGAWSRREDFPRSLAPLLGAAFTECAGLTIITGGTAHSPSTPARRESWWYGAQGGPGWEQAPRIPGAGRSEHSATWDPRRQRVVLYGGRDGPSVTYGDTWEFDGGQGPWVSAPAGPGARHSHGAAWSDRAQAVVVFGGQRAPGVYLSDTWLFDGTRWRPGQLGGPPARMAPGMASRAGGGVLLFGGARDPLKPYLNDSWAYEPPMGVGGSVWRRIYTAHLPAGRCAPMVLVGLDDGVLLFGGQTGGGGVLGDAWALMDAPPFFKAGR